MDVVGVMAAYLPVVRVCYVHCIKLPDDGSLVIRNMLDIFILNILKYFIITLIVSTNYIFVHLLDNKVFKSSYMFGHYCFILPDDDTIVSKHVGGV